jgi:hypothetical protein
MDARSPKAAAGANGCGARVMMDLGLADLYGVETKRLKEQVRRIIERLPADFMFELTKDEFENWRSQFATSN